MGSTGHKYGLDADEVMAVLDIIDTDGDGTCSFGEFVQALRGDHCEKIIEARGRTGLHTTPHGGNF